MTVARARMGIVLAILIVAGPGAPALANEVPEDLIASIKVDPVVLKAGGTAEARVLVTLKTDHHMLGSPAPNKYLTPASLAVESAGGVIAKGTRFPEPEQIIPPGGGRPIHAWGGTVELFVPLEARAGATSGDLILHGRLRYQIYFEGDYFSVATRAVDIPVKVKGGKAKPAPAPAPAPATRP